MCQEAKIYLKIMDVQMQTEGSGWGLFTIAYVTSIGNGVLDPRRASVWSAKDEEAFVKVSPWWKDVNVSYHEGA